MIVQTIVKILKMFYHNYKLDIHNVVTYARVSYSVSTQPKKLFSSMRTPPKPLRRFVGTNILQMLLGVGRISLQSQRTMFINSASQLGIIL